ncbi:MAG: glycosyltransferase family 2 protein [Clostridia bacterium]|nr:glycosyltransferase family 2 protein [Clostridia bacterium]
MQKPFVSVIITTYKRNDLLPRAVDSALNQTYSNIEVIVVDDNDPDTDYRKNTEKFVTERYGRNPKFRYIKMPKNSGACNARNKGVEESKGEFINFLDDDDEFLPTKIEKQIAVFEASDTDLAAVGCYCEILDGNGKLLNIERPGVRGDVFFHQLCNNVTSTPLSLIKKDVYIASGGFEQIKSSQEHLMYSKLYSVNPNFDYVPEVLVRMYHHAGERISSNRNKPLGAIELKEQTKRFYSRLTPEQIEKVEACLNENIFYAYLNCADKKNAKKYLAKIKKAKCVSRVQKFKLQIMCTIGIKNYRKLLALRGKAK